MRGSHATSNAAEGSGIPRLAQLSLFDKVSVGRISETIVARIRQLIREGQLRPGDRLPAERDLCERFGVSPVTVREALRMLASSGLIEMRAGARGRAFVTIPTSEHVGDGLANMLSLSALTATDVTEVRLVLEVGLAPLICARATEEDIQALERICERSSEALKNETYTMDLSAEFHARVAQSTHNPALILLLESFRGPILMSLDQAKLTAPEMGAVGTEEHEAFTQAVRTRDPDLATQIMHEHLERTASRLDH
jgi:DNA-binding FadR family transcriptional regulator